MIQSRNDNGFTVSAMGRSSSPLRWSNRSREKKVVPTGREQGGRWTEWAMALRTFFARCRVLQMCSHWSVWLKAMKLVLYFLFSFCISRERSVAWPSSQPQGTGLQKKSNNWLDLLLSFFEEHGVHTCCLDVLTFSSFYQLPLNSPMVYHCQV